jgi:hypothetical protein
MHMHLRESGFLACPMLRCSSLQLLHLIVDWHDEATRCASGTLRFKSAGCTPQQRRASMQGQLLVPAGSPAVLTAVVPSRRQTPGHPAATSPPSPYLHGLISVIPLQAAARTSTIHHLPGLLGRHSASARCQLAPACTLPARGWPPA